MTNIYELQVAKVVTIASSASLSDALNIQGYDVAAVQTDANLACSAITFQGSVDPGQIALAELVDASNAAIQITHTTATATCHVFQQTKEIRGINQIKVRAGTVSVPSVQSLAVNVWLGLRYAAA